MDKIKQNLSEIQMLHMKAEELCKEKQKNADMLIIEADSKKLLQELQAKKIELELQNEELRHVYEISEIALKKFTMLYDFAPMGFFTLDSEGSICELNFTGAEMLGDKRFSLIGSNFKLFVSKDSFHLFNEFFSKMYTGNAKEFCVVNLDNNNALCLVYMEGIVTGDDRKCLLSVVDISGFKKLNIL